MLRGEQTLQKKELVMRALEGEKEAPLLELRVHN